MFFFTHFIWIELTDAQNVQVMGKTPIEELLKMDNITYDEFATL